jgi:hypothetical protein
MREPRRDLVATPAQYAEKTRASGIDRAHRTVIFASSLGTVFEWYDIVAATGGGIYNGLWYPVIVASITAVIGFLFLRETRGIPLT